MNKREMELFGYLTYKCHILIHNYDLDSGWGDVVIKKNGNGYIFYIVERTNKNNYKELKDFNELVTLVADKLVTDKEDKDYLYSLLEPEKTYTRNLTMMTDLYELTMGQAYLKHHKENEIAVFDVFFRKNPFDKGYGIMGGLHEVIKFLKKAHFNDEDIEYLRSKNIFDEAFLNYLRNFKFHGDVYAIPDGTPVFANEPILTVKAPLIEAQVIETILLSYLNAGIMYITAAKRVTEAAGDISIMEFGARRALGPETATMASVYAIIGGCASTSNVLAGEEAGVEISGTDAHSYITSFPTELDAFIAYADTYPDNCVLLVDTYDVLRSGVPNAIITARYLRKKGHELKGIRIDSGDLAYLTKEAKKMLVEAGFPDVKICVSNSINERTINSLKEQGAVIDAIGLGENIVLPDKARVGCVYKEVALKDGDEYTAKIKASNDEQKAITPGYKKVYRFYDKDTGYALGDVIALYEENIPKKEFTLVDPNNETNFTRITNYNVRPLQETIFENGELVYEEPTILEKKEYCKEQMKTLYPEIKREENPHNYYVDLTRKLLLLKKELLKQAKTQVVDYREEKSSAWTLK